MQIYIYYMEFVDKRSSIVYNSQLIQADELH